MFIIMFRTEQNFSRFYRVFIQLQFREQEKPFWKWKIH